MSQTIMGVVIPDRCGQFAVSVQMDAPNYGFKLCMTSGNYSMAQFISFQDFRGGPSDQSWISNFLQEMALTLEKEIFNGIHRQTAPQAAGGPSPPLIGGGGGGGTSSVRVINYQPGSSGFGGGGAGGSCFYAPQVKTAPLPTEKILLGELTGYRGWQVTPNGFLKSMSAGVIWAPGEPMEGKPTTRNPDGTEGYGVYAYKSKKELLTQVHQDPFSLGHLDVYGSVSLWGEVVEHELGYRAEWAKITNLLGGLTSEGERGLKELRKTYGVT